MKNKLLLTSALVGVVGLAGAASAEFKIGADIVNTITFGSRDAANSAGSGQRIGNEMNLKFTGTANLNNGMKASYNAKWEKDSNGTDEPDHEFEVKIGTDSAWLVVSNDYGLANNAQNTPFIGYTMGSTAGAVTTAVKWGAGFADTYITKVKESDNIGFGATVGNGAVSFKYAPNTNNALGNDINQSANGDRASATGGGYLLTYKGEVAPGLGVNASYTVVTPRDSNKTGVEDEKEKRAGISYKFGNVTAGADFIRYIAGTNSTTGAGDANTNQYGVAFALSDKVSVGAYYAVTTDESTSTGLQDEKYKMLSVGYNLGPASVTANIIDIQGASNVTTTTNADYQGILIATKVAF